MNDQNLSDIVRHHATRTPHHTALACHHRNITYAELEKQSNQYANYLIKMGVTKASHIGLALERSPQLIVSILAITKIGAVYVPIDINYPSERIQFMIEDAELSFLLTTSHVTPSLTPLPIPTIYLDKEKHLILTQSTSNPSFDVKSSNAAYIMYTSGTTGKPKGVVITQRCIMHLTHNPSFLSIDSSDTLALLSTISFDSSTFEIWSALLNGATLAIPPSGKLTPELVSQTIKNYDVSILFLTTGLFNLMMESHLNDVKSLKYIVSGGDVMSPQIVQQALKELPNTTIINGYGPTENTIFTTTFQLPNTWDELVSIPIGRPVAGTVIDITNEQGESVSQGQIGELITSGDGLALGYWRRENLTKERFIKRDGRTYYKTGDLVRQQPDGLIEYIGRNDDQVKIRGFRIELSEIEHVLIQHPSVKSCLVTATEVTPGDKRIIAYIIPSNKKTWDLYTIQTYAKKTFPDFMRPAHYVLLTNFPTTTNGKVDRKALPRHHFDRPKLQTEYVAPTNQTEEALCEIWTDLLKVEPIGTNDHFFDLGGNSILAAKTLMRMQETLHVELPASTLYEHPTIQQVHRMLQNQTPEPKQQLTSEGFLDEKIQPKHLFDSKSFKQNAVLLTGATGFLGAYLIKELVRMNPSIQIYCVIRARDKQHARQRIQVNMEKYHLWDEHYLKQLKPIVGYLDKPQLGLSTEEFQQLAQTIDAIYHNGAKVNYVQPYHMHKDTNVTGTENIIKLACTEQVKPVHFLSTIAIFGPAGYLDGTTVLFEDTSIDAYLPIVEKDIGYSQSKWVAEKIMWEAKKRGVPITVLRPGFIMGDSQTGVHNTEDYMARLIKGCIQLKAYGELPNQRKEFVPVDFVSKAITTICKDPANFGKAYHLVPPQEESMELSEFFQKIIEEIGYPLEKKAYNAWVEALIQASDQNADNALTPFLPMLTEKVEQDKTVWELYENMAHFDSTNTQTVLQAHGMTYPPMDDHLIKRYFKYMEDIGFLKFDSNTALRI
ncbi:MULTISPECIES: non-ribosomal peptide synthetase family protein [Bacillus]|uniref:Amino acid adenylation domain-containing protein n=1 Tax=Bacillus sp. BS1807G30 TaxID=3153756 RepID=A0AAU7FK41_9BACI